MGIGHPNGRATIVVSQYRSGAGRVSLYTGCDHPIGVVTGRRRGRETGDPI